MGEERRNEKAIGTLLVAAALKGIEEAVQQLSTPDRCVDLRKGNADLIIHLTNKREIKIPLNWRSEMKSLFIKENTSMGLGTVSGNSADPVVVTSGEHSAGEAAFHISVAAGGTIFGSSVVLLFKRWLERKDAGNTQIHITQAQLEKAYADMQEALQPPPVLSENIPQNGISMWTKTCSLYPVR
jgi:hypothetical protein